MLKLQGYAPERVFYYFEKISEIPRGSGNMKQIADFCEQFARENALYCLRDHADNVVIKKAGTVGYENAQSIILQGHLDMVCQKNEGVACDFLTDGIELVAEGDYIRANGTTLGADNGIAVAVILAILESNDIAHPPIEAVFTVDEEVGMLGALQLDTSVLSARQMINLDSEDEGDITVSCAGGGDVTACRKIRLRQMVGTSVNLQIKGLKGGHSGVEIHSGRVNADLLLGRLLNEICQACSYEIITVCGGDKANAIPNGAAAVLCTENPQALTDYALACFATIKKEISAREPGANLSVTLAGDGAFSVWEQAEKEAFLLTLFTVPNGVQEMSAEISGLVETSLNLGILNMEKDCLTMCFSLRSCKTTALAHLTQKLTALLRHLGYETETSGNYPPWEYRENSRMQEVFSQVYFDRCGVRPTVSAIHAGLECGVFSSAITGLDCISVGPDMQNVHTTEECLRISSVDRLYQVLIDVLKSLK